MVGMNYESLARPSYTSAWSFAPIAEVEPSSTRPKTDDFIRKSPVDNDHQNSVPYERTSVTSTLSAEGSLESNDYNQLLTSDRKYSRYANFIFKRVLRITGAEKEFATSLDGKLGSNRAIIRTLGTKTVEYVKTLLNTRHHSHRRGSGISATTCV
jgi:hypothetical protein